MSINFKSKGREELNPIDQIACRALAMQARFREDRRTKADFLMDLLAANNTCPLDLERLAGADDFNFVHDVFGIERHLDRATGELTDCFLPRFARRCQDVEPEAPAILKTAAARKRVAFEDRKSA